MHHEFDLYNQAITHLKENAITIPSHMSGESSVSCPGTEQAVRKGNYTGGKDVLGSTDSELKQWPIQLRLINPSASLFDGADLLISADCVPFAYVGFQKDILSGKRMVIFCPKLDHDTDEYMQKLTAIMELHQIHSITVIRMEVPCCGGVRYLVDQAMKRAGKMIPVEEYIVTIQGSLK